MLMNIYFKFAPFFGNWTTIDASELNFDKHENCFFSIAFIPSLDFKLLFRPHSSKFGKFLFIPFAYYSYDSYYSSTFCRLFALRRRLLVGPTSMKYINAKASFFELLLKMSRLTQNIYSIWQLCIKSHWKLLQQYYWHFFKDIAHGAYESIINHLKF